MKNKIKIISTFMVYCIAFTYINDIKAQTYSEDNDNAGIGGTDCSAFGYNALNTTGSGSNNSALGHSALLSTTNGDNNTGAGKEALYSNNADENTAIGFQCMYSNTSGNRNTVAGSQALYGNTTSSENTAVGYNTLAGTNSPNNTAVGAWASAPGNFSNTATIGAYALAQQSDMIRVGDANVTSFRCQVSLTTSDKRVKFNIEDGVKGLDFILRLRPVVYKLDCQKYTEFVTQAMPDSLRKHYILRDFSKASNVIRTGFLAQEVANAARQSKYDFDAVHFPEGENGTFGIAYEQFVVPLTKAIQQQQLEIQNLLKELTSQEKQILARENDNPIHIVSNNPGTELIKLLVTNNFENKSAEVTIVGDKIEKPLKISVFSLSGELIMPYENCESNRTTISYAGLTTGLYFCALLSESNGIVGSTYLFVN